MSIKTNTIWGVKLDRYSQAALFCLVLIVLTGLFSDLIATSRPLYLKKSNETYFPALSNKRTYEFSSETLGKRTYDIDNIDWLELRASNKIFAPIPYDAGKSDRMNASFQRPFSANQQVGLPAQFRHWLGTNLKGDDLLSGIIHGTSVSLKIGFFSILIALIIGVLFGIIAGYFQNDTWKVPLLSFIWMICSIVPSFYLADLFSFFIMDALKWENTLLLIGTILIYLFTIFVNLLLSYFIGKLIHSILKWNKKIYVPVDTIVSRLIEIFAAIPKLMLIVAFAAILERSVTNVILIIGISSWAGIARLVRAEALKLRNQDFITSAKALGLSNYKIITQHLLPNISGPIIVTFVFGLSAAILIESGLSFLNIGVPENVITWGQLLADGKQNFNAWWMIVFPGFAIFMTVLCLNILGEKFKSILDPVNRGLT